jgi:micrococcal nuclease
MFLRSRRFYRPAILVTTAIVACWSAPALADPCEAPLPSNGTAFSGVVRYVGDGDSLCVGPTGRPDRWIEVRLGDFYAPELNARGGKDAKRRLEQIAMDQPLSCRAGKRSYDRVVGYCTVKGQPLGRLLRSNGAVEGGRGWHK